MKRHRAIKSLSYKDCHIVKYTLGSCQTYSGGFFIYWPYASFKKIRPYIEEAILTYFKDECPTTLGHCDVYVFSTKEGIIASSSGNFDDRTLLLPIGRYGPRWEAVDIRSGKVGKRDLDNVRLADMEMRRIENKVFRKLGT